MVEQILYTFDSRRMRSGFRSGRNLTVFKLSMVQSTYVWWTSNVRHMYVRWTSNARQVDDKVVANVKYFLVALDNGK